MIYSFPVFSLLVSVLFITPVQIPDRGHMARFSPVFSEDMRRSVFFCQAAFSRLPSRVRPPPRHAAVSGIGQAADAVAARARAFTSPSIAAAAFCPQLFHALFFTPAFRHASMMLLPPSFRPDSHFIDTILPSLHLIGHINNDN